jgi:hypothetical protein
MTPDGQLAAFLLARAVDLEAVCYGQLDAETWHAGRWRVPDPDADPDYEDTAPGELNPLTIIAASGDPVAGLGDSSDPVAMAHSDHIAAWDPRTTTRVVLALRAQVGLHAALGAGTPPEVLEAVVTGMKIWACAWDSYPGFNPAWRAALPDDEDDETDTQR